MGLIAYKMFPTLLHSIIVTMQTTASNIINEKYFNKLYTSGKWSKMYNL